MLRLDWNTGRPGAHLYLGRRRIHHGLTGVVLILLGAFLAVHDRKDFPVVPFGSYLKLCEEARKLGVHVELFVGKQLIKLAPAAERRQLSQLRLTHSGKELASEPLKGASDLDRAAHVLLPFVAHA